jgi:hypothetical protein
MSIPYGPVGDLDAIDLSSGRDNSPTYLVYNKIEEFGVYPLINSDL